MDQQTLDALAGILRDYGLPLAFLIALLVLAFTGRLYFPATVTTLQAQLAEKDKSHAVELAYRDALRTEEHTARLAAEERLNRALDILDTHTELLREIDRELVRGQGYAARRRPEEH